MNALGRVSQSSRPYFLSNGTPQLITFVYDPLGRAVKVTAPDGSVSQTADHGLTVSNALGSDRYPIGLSAQLDHRVWLGNLEGGLAHCNRLPAFLSRPAGRLSKA